MNILQMERYATTMIDSLLSDFFIRAILAGVVVAILCGPLGCFIVWRRMAYFGDTLAHAALLGVGLSFLLQVNLTLAVFGVSASIAVLTMLLNKRATLSSDSLLGMLSHAGLALGMIVLGLLNNPQANLMGFLFGDILAVSRQDILVVSVCGIGVIAVLSRIWRSLVAATVSIDIAAAEDIKPEYLHFIFMLLMALVIALAMKIVGVLLITSLLIIPAATARNLARSPEQMAVYAGLLGSVSVAGGLYGSLWWDTPAGPSIVLAAFGLFVLSLLVSRSA